MKFKHAYKVITYWCLLLLHCICCGASEMTMRSQLGYESKTQIVAIDFHLKDGEHIVTTGNNSPGVAITFENAKEKRSVFPPKDEIDGDQEGLRGYVGNFSFLYELESIDQERPITYKISYVVCGDTCVPKTQEGIIISQGLITDEEMSKLHEREIDSSEPALWMLMLFGFVGGLLLNFMPCVFPIISLKIFSISKMAMKTGKSIRINASLMALGILSTFLCLGTILSLFKEDFQGIGWGFYMQFPAFVFFLLIIFLACAIHFLGIYHFKMPNMGVSVPENQRSYISSFFSGVFGGLASASCVGPFAGLALAGAILYGTSLQSFLILISLCVGVAFPFFIIGIHPSFVNILPKPGNWLERFKEFMGYAMLLSCVWAISILIEQIGSVAVIKILLISITIAFCLFWLKEVRNSKISKCLALCAGGLIFYGYLETSQDHVKDEIAWVEYTEDILDDALKSGRAVFLNFTATWCMNCKYNQIHFSDPDIVDLFKKEKVLAIKCDWTNQNDKITQLMKKYNAVAIPLNIYYPAGSRDYKILPTMLTKNILMQEIRVSDEQ